LLPNTITIGEPRCATTPITPPLTMNECKRMAITIAQERPDSADGLALIAELDAVLNPSYPPESRHGFRVEQLITQGVAFFIVRVDQQAAGCGGILLVPQPSNDHPYGELKRMYTRPAFRGQGPEFSRRARGIEIWAAIKSLGRSGIADLVANCCRHADHFGHGLRAAGFSVLNAVVLNQVLVRFGSDETTRRVVAAIQADGTYWCGATIWHGQATMRISVSSWATTSADVEQSLATIIQIARQITADSQ
jgi:hypothetical protein